MNEFELLEPVKILGKSDKSSYWSDKMEKDVGKTFVVIEITKEGGFGLSNGYFYRKEELVSNKH